MTAEGSQNGRPREAVENAPAEAPIPREVVDRRASWLARAAGSAYVVGTATVERGLPRWPPSLVARVQDRRVRAIVRHAYDTVPFYRDAMRERGLRPEDFRTTADLARLPTIDGLSVARNPERFTSEAYDDESRESFQTSGSSSGVRRRIYWDRAYVLRGLACAERDRIILTSLAGESRVRTVLRELVGDHANPLVKRLVGASENHQRISIFPGDAASRTIRIIWSEQTLMPRKPAHHHFIRPMLPLEEAAARMDEIRPRIVFSFGSYADQFFRFLASRDMEIALPRVWMYTGDGVSKEGRDLAEERYGCKLYSVYSSVEAHRLGVQCERRRGFHLNLDLFAFSLVGEDGRPVPPGEPGDVVVSNLHNRAMVLLNYRLGDRAVIDPEPCPCGRRFPLLSHLEGRKSEVVRLADGREMSSLTLDNLFTDELKPTLKSQLAQARPGAIRWRIVPFEGVDRDALRESLVARSRVVLGADTELDVEFVDDIAPTKQGKFLQVVREPDESPALSAEPV